MRAIAFPIPFLLAAAPAQTIPDPCGALVPGTPIAATNPVAPTPVTLGNATTVQIEILGHSENRGYHTHLQQLLNAAPPLPGVTFVVTNRWIGGHEAWRWATPGQLGYQRIQVMLATRQHPTIVLGLFSNNETYPIANPLPGDPDFDRFVGDLAAIADHAHDNGNGATMVYFSSHRYKPVNMLPAFHERAAVEHLVGAVAPATGRTWIAAGPEQHDLHWCCYPSCYAPDLAHTNAAGDMLMAEAWYALLMRELRECYSEPFGAGTAGTGGTVPILSPSGGFPVLGSATFALTLHDARPNALAVHAVGGPSGTTPILVQAFVGWIGITDAQGEHVQPLGLPNDPAFHGLSLFAQSGVLDPSGTVSGFATSQGLRINLCR
ncbi:MAG: hypothetical protein KDE27_22735 [Planctomycetes bacterium]|nr:hypothetical protein [Planctomycetota bacterium]